MKTKKLILVLAALMGITISAHSQDFGEATYYANRFHGRLTSDGSRYHRDSLTCAHKTYPFGTYLKVRNTLNGEEVVVKVNDRGPFRPGTIVDLSYAAAEKIGMIREGVVPVEVEILDSPDDYKAGPAREELRLPELQLFDAATGEYYTVSEWMQRDEEEKARAREAEADQQRASYAAQAQQEKRWHVLNDQMTAQSTLKAAAGTGLFRRDAAQSR